MDTLERSSRIVSADKDVHLTTAEIVSVNLRFRCQPLFQIFLKLKQSVKARSIVVVEGELYYELIVSHPKNRI